MSHAASVRALYTELPHLSKSDGMRFAAKEELRDHLDWLFKQNRRKQAQSQNVVIGGLSRCWYDGVERFVNEKDEVKAEGSNGGADVKNVNVNERNTGAGNGEADSAKDSIDAVESRGDNEICAACQEGFETFWDDDRHAWMLKGATRTDDGEIFHSKCVDLTDDVRHVEADDAAEAEESRDEDLLKSLAKQEDAVGETKASEADDDAGSDGENSKKRKREDVKADAEGIVKQEDMGIEEAREKRVKVEGGGVVGIAEVPGAGSVS